MSHISVCLPQALVIGKRWIHHCIAMKDYNNPAKDPLQLPVRQLAFRCVQMKRHMQHELA